MTKAAIFDLDGTIADTIPDITTAISASRALRGLPPVDEAFVLTFINGDSHDFMRSAFPNATAEQAAEWLSDYARIYSECMLQKTKPYNGVTELLLSLKEKGIKLAVFSNKDDEHVKKICAALFPGIFDITLGAGIFPSKPAPDGALDILHRFGVRADEAVYIGDSDVDIKTARNALIRAVGVSWGYRGRDYLENLGGCDVVDGASEILNEILK